MLWTASIVCFIAALLITPVVKRFAIAVGAVDSPDARKVHVRIMPRLGGLAIYIAFMIGYFHSATFKPVCDTYSGRRLCRDFDRSTR